MKLLFGTGGTPVSSPKRDSITGITTIRKLGLDCMELEFVQGVKMKEEMAEKVKEHSKELGIVLTAHAPYFINLNSKDSKKLKASMDRIIETARIGMLCGAKSITFHPGFMEKDPPSEVLKRIVKAIKKIEEEMEEKGIVMDIRPETTGKPSQFGSLSETLELCAETGLLPCIDFAHLHAREMGRYKNANEFAGILEKMVKVLGKGSLKNMHIHISGIKYGKKGEIKHLNLKEADLNYEEILKVLIDFGVEGVIISESPDLEGDAILMKNTYKKLGGK